MKWFVFSDLHGSAFYCEKVVKAFETEDPDRIIFLGDLLNHGPKKDPPERYGPPELIDMLNAYGDRIVAVMGNCDISTDHSVMKFPFDSDLAAINFGDRTVYATHGHIYNENNIPAIAKGDILLHGHSHIPAYVEYEDFTYANPGSVALPKGDSCNSYMIMTEEGMVWKDLDGNVWMEHSFRD